MNRSKGNLIHVSHEKALAIGVVILTFLTLVNFVSWDQVPEEGLTGGEVFDSSVLGKSGEFYAVGLDGAILHYKDQKWQEMDIGTDSNFFGVWGTSKERVYAVGKDVVYIYDGKEWLLMDGGAFGIPRGQHNAIWGTSENSIYLVGNSPVGTGRYYYGGERWDSMMGGIDWTFNSIWGASENEVYTVGTAGAIFYHNEDDKRDRPWRAMDSGITYDLHGIWGFSSEDMFAVGGSGTILHYDGKAWKSMDSGTTKFLRSVWGTSSDNLYAVGNDGSVLHYNGEGWGFNSLGINEDLYGVYGTSADNIFAVGETGTIFHFDGIEWRKIEGIPFVDLRAVWAS